jgi:hypothetical protein
MSPATIFQLHLVLGYLPWLLCFGVHPSSTPRQIAKHARYDCEL